VTSSAAWDKKVYQSFLALNKQSSPSAKAASVTFPTFWELVSDDAERGPAAAPRQRSLFEALIGDPRILYQEVLEDPNRFQPESVTLLQQVIAGTKRLSTLTSAEQELLNSATVAFTRPRRLPDSPLTPSAHQDPSPAVAHLTREDKIDDPEEDLTYNEDGSLGLLSEESVELSDEPAPTFWWK
jgi:hypothetical protein